MFGYIIMYRLLIQLVSFVVGGAVASGLVRHLRIEWSGFEPWPGTLCCVLGQVTLNSHCAPLHPAV